MNIEQSGEFVERWMGIVDKLNVNVENWRNIIRWEWFVVVLSDL